MGCCCSSKKEPLLPKSSINYQNINHDVDFKWKTFDDDRSKTGPIKTKSYTEPSYVAPIKQTPTITDQSILKNNGNKITNINEWYPKLIDKYELKLKNTFQFTVLQFKCFVILYTKYINNNNINIKSETFKKVNKYITNNSQTNDVKILLKEFFIDINLFCFPELLLQNLMKYFDKNKSIFDFNNNEGIIYVNEMNKILDSIYKPKSLYETKYIMYDDEYKLYYNIYYPKINDFKTRVPLIIIPEIGLLKEDYHTLIQYIALERTVIIFDYRQTGQSIRMNSNKKFMYGDDNSFIDCACNDINQIIINEFNYGKNKGIFLLGHGLGGIILQKICISLAKMNTFTIYGAIFNDTFSIHGSLNMTKNMNENKYILKCYNMSVKKKQLLSLEIVKMDESKENGSYVYNDDEKKTENNQIRYTHVLNYDYKNMWTNVEVNQKFIPYSLYNRDINMQKEYIKSMKSSLLSINSKNKNPKTKLDEITDITALILHGKDNVLCSKDITNYVYSNLCEINQKYKSIETVSHGHLACISNSKNYSNVINKFLFKCEADMSSKYKVSFVAKKNESNTDDLKTFSILIKSNAFIADNDDDMKASFKITEAKYELQYSCEFLALKHLLNIEPLKMQIINENDKIIGYGQTTVTTQSDSSVTVDIYSNDIKDNYNDNIETKSGENATVGIEPTNNIIMEIYITHGSKGDYIPTTNAEVLNVPTTNDDNDTRLSDSYASFGI